MIVLDTNVVSELMRASPAAQVERFVEGFPAETVVTTSITVAEIRYGIRRHPSARRRSELERSFTRLLERGFGERLWSFDADAADHYSQIVVERERAGRRMEAFDAMIAGIARSRAAEVATRDVADFEGCGIAILNPWDQ